MRQINRQINSTECLKPGTQVQVKNLLGTVTESKMVPATPSGMVCLHTIRFHTRRERLHGSKYVLKDISEKIKTVSYVGIYTRS